MTAIVFIVATSTLLGLLLGRWGRQPASYECHACGDPTATVAFYLDRPVCLRCAPSACRAARQRGK